MDDREARLVRACEVANADPELLQLEQEFDAFQDKITKPWEDDYSESGLPR